MFLWAGRDHVGVKNGAIDRRRLLLSSVLALGGVWTST
jgi:hypothetical protein